MTVPFFMLVKRDLCADIIYPFIISTSLKGSFWNIFKKFLLVWNCTLKVPSKNQTTIWYIKIYHTVSILCFCSSLVIALTLLFVTRDYNLQYPLYSPSIFSSWVVGGDCIMCFCGIYTPGFFREIKIGGLTQFLEVSYCFPLIITGKTVADLQKNPKFSWM